MLTYYKCTGKCGNTSVRKLDIEQMALEHVHDVCFTEEAIQEVVRKVKVLFHEQQNNSRSEKKAIEKEMQSLEISVNNWIDALGKGIKGLEDKIVDAQNRYEILQIELHKMDSLNQTIDISEDLIRSVITNKKHLIQSTDEADQKEVLQEYVDQVMIQPSDHLNDFRADITYRVFKYGGEGSRTPVRRYRHISFYGCSDS